MAEIKAELTGSVRVVQVKVGDSVSEGDTVIVLESMKMEIPVEADKDGVVAKVLVEEGASVKQGDTLVVLR